MNTYSKSLITALIALLAAFGASAQDTTSPYSKFGYGLLRDNATSAQRAMGGVGYAMNSGRQINAMNPASYAMVDTLTFLFDTGVSLANLWSKDGKATDRTTGGGLDYVTMQFPVGSRLGMSVGLVPYSSVGYSFGSSIDNGLQLREGSGGLSQLYVGIAGRICKGLSVGTNISYLFGTTYNTAFATSSIGTTSLFSQEMDVRDFHLDFGAQYTFAVSRRSSLTLGLVFSPGKTLLGHTMVTTAESTPGSSTSTNVDTVAYVSLKDRFSLPCTWGAGVAYKWNSRLLVEADFTYQPWADAKFPTLDSFLATTFRNRWKVALGANYLINPRGNYLQRINWRAGAFYNHDYISVNTNNVAEWGASIGFGLPAPAGKTLINLGLEYRNRRAHPSPLLREQYLTVTLGINFNEVWFWQNKIR